jgi:putative SOS response-associated peptidase YedK
LCGRYTFFTDKELSEIDEIIEQVSNEVQLEKMKTGEIFPTDLVPVLLPQDEIIIPRLMIWGFPHFQDKGVTINARSETVQEKKLFASSLEQRRCVIPSTGFFEWDAAKKKYLFNMPGSRMLYMAGIYNRFANEVRFVILTTEANRSVEEIHKRMPVVISKDKMKEWLFDFNSVENILFGPV